jgi:hypothetical protein
MNMHPDDQMHRDMLIMTLALATMLLVSIAYCFQSSGYSEADACANRVREAISPYQVKQLIDSKQLPPTYDEVKQWCTAELTGYELKIDIAKTFPEFPRTTDMLY